MILLVSQFFAITASHCFDAYPNTATIALLVGDHDTSIGSETIWAAVYLLQYYKKHNEYNSETNSNDIALMKTRDYIRFRYSYRNL